MKYRGIGIVIIALILVLGELPSSAQSTLFPQHPMGLQQKIQYAPRQPVGQPVARTVSVQVPVPCAPPVLPPCSSGEVRYGPSRTLPVRVEVAVRPEPGCDSRRIPVAFRDPGPLQPIISNGVGLIGSTLAAPFRVAEMLCPLPQRTCKPDESAFLRSDPPCFADVTCLSSNAFALPWWPSCLLAACCLRTGRACRCPLATSVLCASDAAECPAEARGGAPIPAV